MIPTQGRVIGIDWGEVRIGLALSDETQLLASPLETLSRRPGRRFPMPRFLELVTEHRPVGVVVGLPLTPDGTEEESAKAARELGVQIGQRTYLLRNFLADMPPVEAMEFLLERLKRTKNNKEFFSTMAQ